MKHPALARVFSVILAIASLILLAVGVRGVGKTGAEYAERLAYAEKFAGRIENYRKLRAQVQKQPDYDRAMGALKAFVSAHEKAASKHKTDTAIYTATKGGLKMGEDMIVAGRMELEEAKVLLRDPATRNEVLESTLSQAIAAYKPPWLDSLAAWAVNCADKSYRESGMIGSRAGHLRLLMSVEPQPYEDPGGDPGGSPDPGTEPTAPTPPEPPVFPEMGDAAEEERQAAYREIMAEYEAASAAYMQAYAQYQQDLFAYQCAVAEREAAAVRGEQARAMNQEYYTSHEAWEAECRSYRSEPAFPQAGEAIHELCCALASMESQIRGQAPELWEELSGSLPSIAELDARGIAAAEELSRQVTEATAAMSNEEYLAYADEAQGLLDELSDAFFAVGAALSDPSHLIVKVMDKLNLTDAVAEFVGDMLKKAGNQLQAALEELWYQAGELKKDQIKLEAEKHSLDREAKVVSTRTKRADEMKDLKNRYNAARLQLLNVPEVKDGMTDEESLPESAERYLEDYRARTDTLRAGRRIINTLAIAGGIMGAAGIPAAYELLKKRFWLLAPVLLCMLCSAAAELLHLKLGLGQMYVALFTAILALVQLLIILPRKKKRPLH